MADKTKTVYHPTFHDVSLDVSEGDAKTWKEQGWRFTPISEKSNDTGGTGS